MNLRNKACVCSAKKADGTPKKYKFCCESRMPEVLRVRQELITLDGTSVMEGIRKWNRSHHRLRNFWEAVVKIWKATLNIFKKKEKPDVT